MSLSFPSLCCALLPTPNTLSSSLSGGGRGQTPVRFGRLVRGGRKGVSEEMEDEQSVFAMVACDVAEPGKGGPRAWTPIYSQGTHRTECSTAICKEERTVRSVPGRACPVHAGRDDWPMAQGPGGGRRTQRRLAIRRLHVIHAPSIRTDGDGRRHGGCLPDLDAGAERDGDGRCESVR